MIIKHTRESQVLQNTGEKVFQITLWQLQVSYIPPLALTENKEKMPSD